MNAGISKKMFAVSTVFSGLMAAMGRAESPKERVIFAGIILAGLVIYMGLQFVLDLKAVNNKP